MASTFERRTGRLTVALSPAQQAAITPGDLEEIGDDLDTALAALAALRGQDPDELAAALYPDAEVDGAGAWSTAIGHTNRLIERLEGVRDAAIREHAGLGGSYGSLSSALRVPKSTAQWRRDALLDRAPGPGEVWATGRANAPSAP
jgi:hypothetical protein